MGKHASTQIDGHNSTYYKAVAKYNHNLNFKYNIIIK